MGVAGSSHPKRPSGAGGRVRSSSPTRNNSAPARNGNGVLKSGPLVFTIKSELSASRDVQKAIMDRVEHCHYGEQSTFAIRLALEEGLMNAIKHGNKLDP